MIGTLKNRVVVLSALVVSGLAINATRPVQAEVIFEDHIDNVNNWTTVNGGGPTLVTVDPKDASNPHIPYMQLNNSMVYTTLPSEISTSWTLSWTMRQDASRRSIWVGMLNADGTQGYTGYWDSSTSQQGFVNIRKIDASHPLGSGFGAGGVISSNGGSGHDVVSSSFASFVLTWDKSTGELTLSADGQERVSVIDPDFSSFSRIYVYGNGPTASFDDFKLTVVPEPGSMGLLAVSSLLLLRRRRRFYK